MDWWQVLLIALGGLSMLLGGTAAWKRKWKKVLMQASEGTKEMSEAFYGSSLIGIKASEVLEKLANDPSSLSKEEITAVWRSCQSAGTEWAEAFQAVKELFYDLH